MAKTPAKQKLFTVAKTNFSGTYIAACVKAKNKREAVVKVKKRAKDGESWTYYVFCEGRA